MTIHPNPIRPGPYTLGGARFFGRDKRLLTVEADASGASEAPIEFHVCSGSHRGMLNLSTEEAEALASCLVTAVRLRRVADDKAKCQDAKQARAFFADSDGQLETA